MKFLKAIIEFFVFASILVASAAAALVAATALLVGMEVDWILVSFVFSSTVFSYNFQRFARFGDAPPPMPYAQRIQWLYDNQHLVFVLMLVSGVAAFVLFWFFEADLRLLSISLGSLAVFYALKVLPAAKTLRDLPGLKIFIIALTWAGVTVLLPMYSTELPGHPGWSTALHLFVQRFLFILAITIPFDIRDLKYDEDGKNTIPQLMGVKAAIRFAIVLLVVAAALFIWKFSGASYVSLLTAVGYISSLLIALVIVALTNEKRGEYFYAVLLESTILVQAGAIWLGVLVAS